MSLTLTPHSSITKLSSHADNYWFTSYIMYLQAFKVFAGALKTSASISSSRGVYSQWANDVYCIFPTKCINSAFFGRIYKCHHIFVEFTIILLNLRIFHPPVYCPWCIYASCLKRTERPCTMCTSIPHLDIASCSDFLFVRCLCNCSVQVPIQSIPRSFSVKPCCQSCQALPLACGVPQGSVLGPLLSILFITPLIYRITSSSAEHHLYADDPQLFRSFSTRSFPTRSHSHSMW